MQQAYKHTTKTLTTDHYYALSFISQKKSLAFGTDPYPEYMTVPQPA